MVLYLILIVALATLLVVSLHLNSFEVLAPTVLNTAAFLMASICCVIGLASWNRVVLGTSALLIITLGCIGVIVGGAIALRMLERHALFADSVPISRRGTTWGYSYVKFAVLLVFLAFAFALHVHETFELAPVEGYDVRSLQDVMGWARLQSFQSGTAGVRFGEGYSFLERLCTKVVYVSGFVCMYFMVRNRMFGQDRRELILPFACYLVTCVYALVAQSRGVILYSIVSGVYAAYIIAVQRGDSTCLINKRVLRVLLVLAFVSVPLFYVLAFVLGRGLSGGPVAYITYYVGGGIPSLQYMLDAGMPSTSLPGEYSFHGIYVLLYKFGIISNVSPYSGDFIFLNGYPSNIYTMFYRYYVDFGIVGVAILSMLVGAFFTMAYTLAKRISNPAVLVSFMLVGCYLFDMNREEYVFSRMLSGVTVLQLVIASALVLWLTWPHDNRMCIRLGSVGGEQ